MDRPQQVDLDRCVHCGLCLNACPTYRVLGVEMDSPRGRIFQMAQVASGAPITASYVEHIDLCLACRGCESACPSGVQYGRIVEAARAQIESHVSRSWGARLLRGFFFGHLLTSPALMKGAGRLLHLYQRLGVRPIRHGRLADLERLAPPVEPPFFFRHIGKTFPSEGPRRYRVAFMAGCIANVCFARLNEATVRVLQKNGCDVVIPAGQGCCGALHVHAGLPEDARVLARRNIDALQDGFDAIVTNAAGCGSTLKEYGDLLRDDPAYADRAREFAARMRDVTEFLAAIEWNRDMGSLPLVVTYQDSCHLAHGQRVRSAPRRLLESIPGLSFREMPIADLCCGSAGIYNVVENEMSMQILARKMESVNQTGAQVVATANPGCMLQLRAGVGLYGQNQRVVHVIELLDEGYRQAR